MLMSKRKLFALLWRAEVTLSSNIRSVHGIRVYQSLLVAATIGLTLFSTPIHMNRFGWPSEKGFSWQ